MSDPFAPHSHDNNEAPPDLDPTIWVKFVDRSIDPVRLSLELLQNEYPHTILPAYTFQTDHGAHGPYRLEGVSLIDVIDRVVQTAEPNDEVGNQLGWQEVVVVSADGFGNRVDAAELLPPTDQPILLCWRIDGNRLTRAAGLVRLVVPSEIDNALRQVKWVRELRIFDKPTGLDAP